MSCLSSARRAELRARLVTKEAQLVKLNQAYDDAIDNGGISSYRLGVGDGDGEQQTKYRGLGEISNAISALEADIDRINRQLAGRGLSNMNMRRGR